MSNHETASSSLAGQRPAGPGARSALDSVLFSRPREGSPTAWSAIGATEPPSYEELGPQQQPARSSSPTMACSSNNAGDNYPLARPAGRSRSSPINRCGTWSENGQGHAAMGPGGTGRNKQGATIIAHADNSDRGAVRRSRSACCVAHETAVAWVRGCTARRDLRGQTRRRWGTGESSCQILGRRTAPATSPCGYHSKGRHRRRYRLSPAHAAGVRHTDTAAWIRPGTVSPRSVRRSSCRSRVPTDMTEVTRYTRDTWPTCGQIGVLIENGGLRDVSSIDQYYSHLDTYDELQAQRQPDLSRWSSNKTQPHLVAGRSVHAPPLDRGAPAAATVETRQTRS